MKRILLSLTLLAVPFSVAEAQGGQQLMAQKTLPLSADTTGFVAVSGDAFEIPADANFQTLDGSMSVSIWHYTDTLYQYQVRDSTWDLAAYRGKDYPTINQMTIDFIELGGKEWGRLVFNDITDGVVTRRETLRTSINNRRMLIVIFGTPAAYKKNEATIRRFVNSLRPL